ncbi:MAG: hypothetical protein ABIL91_08005 [candidate division WOR-3 bacterium]
MEDKRVKFNNKKERQRFFNELKEKLRCITYKQLAKKLKITEGNLKQWKSGARSIPFSLIQEWANLASIALSKYKTRTLSIKSMLKNASRRGVRKLKKKYGNEWMKKLGKRGRKGLQKLLETNPKIYKKWRESIKKSLEVKFGPEWYKIIGQKGGRKSVKSTSPSKLRERLKKAFRKSFSFRIKYGELNLRSYPAKSGKIPNKQTNTI